VEVGFFRVSYGVVVEMDVLVCCVLVGVRNVDSGDVVLCCFEVFSYSFMVWAVRVVGWGLPVDILLVF